MQISKAFEIDEIFSSVSLNNRETKIEYINILEFVMLMNVMLI